MKRVTPSSDWPESWKLSHQYDLMEIYGEKARSGYAQAYAVRRARTLQLVDRVAQPGARILDLAAGQGNFTLTLAERGFDVTWNDLRAELADYVKLKLEKGVVRFLAGNVFELRMDERFDVVLITEVIEHVAHPDGFLRKVSELLKPGGHIVMSTPNGEYFRNRLPKFSDCPDPSVYENAQFKPDGDGHIFLLHRDELEGFARQAGLEILDFLLYANSLTSGHMKLGHLLPWIPPGLVNALEKVTERLPERLSRKLHTGFTVLFRRT